MKKVFLPLILIFTVSFPSEALSQQINDFQECVQHREVYTPGGFDEFGNFRSGWVSVETFNVPCNNVQFRNPPRSQYRNPAIQRVPVTYGGYYYCNPTRSIWGAALGGSIGRALTSTRNNRRNRGWATALGASLGGLAYSC